jgi:hypothetical protein
MRKLNRSSSPFDGLLSSENSGNFSASGGSKTLEIDLASAKTRCLRRVRYTIKMKVAKS